MNAESNPDLAAELAEAKARVRHLSENLPTAVDPLAISKIAKTPYVALCFREGQAWRVVECARAACDMFERGDLVVAISNTRQAAESAAAVWYLRELIEKQLAAGVTPGLHDIIMRLHVGWKNKPDPEMPEAINVLTMIKKADEKLPGFLQSYEKLREIAHPNYNGSAAMYSRHDKSTLITHFGKGLRNQDHSLRLGLNCLIGAMLTFEHAYNRIGDLTPEFAAACPQRESGKKKWSNSQPRPSEEDQGVLQHNRGHSGDRAALGSAPWAAIEVLSRLFFKWHVRDRPS